MLVDGETIQTFFDLLLSLSKETAIQAHKYLECHNKITGYCKYPVKYELFDRSDSKYSELFQTVPFLMYDIPKYVMKDFPEDSPQYGAIFYGYSKEHLDCTSLQEFNVLFEFIKNKLELKQLITEKDDDESLKNRIKKINTEIVERYLYSINATHEIPDDLEIKIETFIIEKMIRYLSAELKIDIYVPICLATFEDDVIKLSEEVEIIRISEDIQKSRQESCPYEAVNENWVAACATHMIVLHNYHLKNTGDISIFSLNYHSYPIQTIDNIIAAIRVITGYNIGYAQILSRPLNWIDIFCADLIPLYGAKAYFVNPKETEKFWMNLPVSKVSKEQSQQIQKLYSAILECESDKTRGSLLFALKRFNRCMLRNEEDDMATDATIGIEALLSGGTKEEISYTISNRIPIVFSYEHSDMYLPTNCRSIMKKIYNYRSKIVHGGTMKDKDRYHEIGDHKIEIAKIAVEFLRYTLLFILHNPEFLNTKKFDEYIDSII